MKVIVYSILNTKNGKIYVGQTRQKLKDRFNRHLQRAIKETYYKNAISNAIREFGKDSFQIKELEVVETVESGLEKEKYWIQKYNCIYPNGYNMTKGGGVIEGHKHTDISKELMRNKKKDIFDGNKNPFYGKTHSEAQKEKWREERKGRILTEEWIKNISNTRKRKPVINLSEGIVFESIRHACRYYGKNPDHGTSGSISNVCNKKRNKTVLGFIFEYYNSDIHDNTVPSLRFIKEEGVTTIRKE